MNEYKVILLKHHSFISVNVFIINAVNNAKSLREMWWEIEQFCGG